MRYIYQILTLVVVAVIQVLTSDLIAIFGASPDFVLIFIVWITVQRGQLTGELVGFGAGFLLDVLSSGALGAQALSKSIAGFIIGYFYNDDEASKRLRSWHFLAFVFCGACINNLIYHTLFSQASSSYWEHILVRGLYSAAYTTIVAVIPMIFFSRRHSY